jgi:hypothetical protein
MFREIGCAVLAIAEMMIVMDAGGSFAGNDSGCYDGSGGK